MAFAMKPVCRKSSLLFTACLLFAMFIVAFDRHGPVRDETCLICAMGSSLCSVLGESQFTPEAQPVVRYACIVEDTRNAGFFAVTPGISYRGLPLPAGGV